MPTGNTVLDEIQAKKPGDPLSPEAQQAVDLAAKRSGTPTPAAPTPQVNPAAIIHSGAPGPPPIPVGSPPATAPVIPSPHVAELNRLTAPPPTDPAMLHTAANTGAPGIDQIHHAAARIPLKILSAVGEGLFPGIAMHIPGTELHHEQLVRGAEGAVKNDLEQQKGEESRRLTESEIPKNIAQGNEAQARADELAHPKPEKVTNEFQKWMADNPTASLEDWEKFKSAHQEVVKVATPFEKWMKDNPNATVSDWLKLENENKQPKEGETPLGPRVAQINKAMTARYQVLHPGAAIPPHYVLPAEATQKDFDRTDKLIEGEEKAFGTNENRKQTDELRKQTMALAQANREQKTDTGVKHDAYKAYQPALDSAERFNIMTKNFEDATKNHDQQAMLSLLANHLGMTMGLQKGARMTKDIIQEAEKSRPWLQGLAAKFDKDGYLSGVTLTEPQMQQMVSLGRERFAEDLTKSHNEAKYLGATDEGPERTPSRATINFYVKESGGDVAKAKARAAADGWTVK